MVRKLTLWKKELPKVEPVEPPPKPKPKKEADDMWVSSMLDKYTTADAAAYYVSSINPSVSDLRNANFRNVTDFRNVNFRDVTIAGNSTTDIIESLTNRIEQLEQELRGK